MKQYSKIEDLQLLSETALESSLAGFWDWNMVTNEEYLSPRFKEMFGYADDEMENSPESWQKIAFPEDLPVMFENFQKHVASKGKIPFSSIVRYHHKNGSTVWVKCNGQVVEWSENNEPLRAIGCHVDITEEKENEIRLKKIIEERDLLLKEVHHRVKNNLQLLMSLARLKNKNGVINFNQIEDSINSIARAYEALYQAEKINEVPLKTYFEQVVKPIISGQNVEFVLDVEAFNKDIDFLIPIGLAMTELVNNTLKYGLNPDSVSKVTIKSQVENNELVLYYSDNGSGYGNVLNELNDLESFGLSIIEGLIEQMDGKVSFYDDNGACAKIAIPFE